LIFFYFFGCKKENHQNEHNNLNKNSNLEII
jgi:hypothetical protein